MSSHRKERPQRTPEEARRELERRMDERGMEEVAPGHWKRKHFPFHELLITAMKRRRFSDQALVDAAKLVKHGRKNAKDPDVFARSTVETWRKERGSPATREVLDVLVRALRLDPQEAMDLRDAAMRKKLNQFPLVAAYLDERLRVADPAQRSDWDRKAGTWDGRTDEERTLIGLCRSLHRHYPWVTGAVIQLLEWTYLRTPADELARVDGPGPADEWLRAMCSPEPDDSMMEALATVARLWRKRDQPT